MDKLFTLMQFKSKFIKTSHISSIPSGNGRSPVVKASVIPMEWEGLHITSRVTVNNLRYFSSRLGNLLQWSTDSRFMVSSEAISTNQLLLNPSNLTGCEDLYKEKLGNTIILKLDNATMIYLIGYHICTQI